MASPPRAAPFRRGLAFAAGLGFAVVPAIGPFLALLAVATGRLEIHRADRWWWLCAALLGVPLMVTGHAMAGALTIGQVLAVWLIFRSASAMRRVLHDASVPNDIGGGLVVGLALTLTIGLRQLDAMRLDTALTLLDSLTWHGHSALFGHAILVLSSLLAVVVPSARLRIIALALGGVGVVLSGAREAMFVWLLVAIGIRLLRRGGGRNVKIAEWTLIALMAVIASGAATLVGLGRPGFVTNLILPASEEANLLRGTEIAVGDWWHHLGVGVVSRTERVAGEERTVFIVTKAWPEPWARLQQVVTLVPGETYTLSAAWRATDGLRPGLDGWGRPGGGERDTVLTSTVSAGALSAGGSGGVVVLDATLEPLGDGWERGAVTFRFEGERPLGWYTGVVVDRTRSIGAQLAVSEMQLTATSERVSYAAGIADRGTDLQSSRLPIWRDALAAIAARPLWGWGTDGLPRSTAQLRPDETRVRPVAAHAHNAVLAAWVDRGVFGAVGLLGLMVLLSLRAVQQRDRAAVVVILGVLILNVFDATLLAGSVIYPLAAVLGWRAMHPSRAAVAETGVGSFATVRTALALGDAAAGAIAVSLATLAVGTFDPAVTLGGVWTTPLAYAVLVWPAMAAWSGLYPGYGLASHVSLARTVRAAGAGAVALGFGALLFPEALPLPGTVVVLAGIISVIAAPAIRAFVKASLRDLRLWGRPVVLLGSSEASARVARHLLAYPGIGLHPVAAFGNADGWHVSDLPVMGPLDAAWRYVAESGVRHAIVAPDAASGLDFDEVLLRANRRLRYVQFLPELQGLPAASFTAAPLGTALSLEIRNELASATNRSVKRAMDLIGAALLLAALAPMLALIALWIRRDSPGPALYRSERLGRYGRTFGCLKFRTMFVDADARLADLMAGDETLRDEYGRYHKLQDDPRVTGAGHWLRRSSLDELPQLVNVLLGDMSLVGPRPYLLRELEQMGSERELVFLARPGMTGYWQVSGRNDITFAERQAMEAHYVRNWSVWWDVELVLRTPLVLARRTGR